MVKVMSWNLQGAGAGFEAKAQVAKDVIGQVRPDILGLVEVSWEFPFDEVLGGYSYHTRMVNDSNGKPQPKNLVFAVRKDSGLQWQGPQPVRQQAEYTTAAGTGTLKRPIDTFVVNEVECHLVHAPANEHPASYIFSGFVIDMFARAFGRGGRYRAFAFGDFNYAFPPFYTNMYEQGVANGGGGGTPNDDLITNSVSTVHPGWTYTHRHGKILDYIITCNLYASANTQDHQYIEEKNTSKYIDPVPLQSSVASGPRGDVGVGATHRVRRSY